MAELVERDEELVVNRVDIIEESIGYGLNTVDAFVIEGGAEGGFRVILDLGAIDDGSVPVRIKLAFFGVRMIPFEAEIGNVVFHGEAAGVISLIPLEVDSGIQIALPIYGDVVVFLEGIAKVLGMPFTNIFSTKVVHNEFDEDRTPVVTP